MRGKAAAGAGSSKCGKPEAENNATHAGNCTERERGGFALSHLERGALNFLLRAIRAAERFQASSLEATRKLGNLDAGWL